MFLHKKLLKVSLEKKQNTQIWWWVTYYEPQINSMAIPCFLEYWIYQNMSYNIKIWHHFPAIHRLSVEKESKIMRIFLCMLKTLLILTILTRILMNVYECGSMYFILLNVTNQQLVFSLRCAFQTSSDLFVYANHWPKIARIRVSYIFVEDKQCNTMS